MKKYLKNLGVDLEKWKDFPTTFRTLEEESLDLKSKKTWSYLVNIAEETVFLSFVTKFDDLLPGARIHVTDGFWQDTTYSLLFENGSRVF